MNNSRLARRSDYIGAASLLCLWAGCALAPVVAVWQVHTLPWLFMVAVTQGVFGALTWHFGSQVGPEISRSFVRFIRGDRDEKTQAPSEARRVWRAGDVDAIRRRDRLDV